MRIVADTNIIVSALFWQKQLSKFSELVNKRKIVLRFSPDTITELNRVIFYPAIKTKIEKENLNPVSLIDNLIAASLIVHPTVQVSVIKEDTSDNMFLSCALAAEASFIVSGDKHLLKLKTFSGMPIITPAQFIKIISQKKKP